LAQQSLRQLSSLFYNHSKITTRLFLPLVAITRWYWPAIPPLGMVTFVDHSKVRRKRDPGRCYRRAGFHHVGFTEGGLWAFQLKPEAMPEPALPEGVLL
jgi:hypothetical protein